MNSLISLIFLISLFSLIHAQPFFPVHGDVNALIVLVQFDEDVYEHCAKLTHYSVEGMAKFEEKPYAECENREKDGFEIGDYQSWTDDAQTEWKSDLPRLSNRTRTLPTFANKLIDAPNDLRIHSGSLTDFYHRMSGGKFNFRGLVYPSVYIPQFSQNEYLDSKSDYPNGVVRLSAEILAFVNQNPQQIPLQDTQIWDKYSNGKGDIPQPDGIFDMVILVTRFNGFQRILGGSGISSFGVGYDFNAFQLEKALKLGDLAVHEGFPKGSGVHASGISLKSIQAMIIHEIGHRQFGAYHAESPFEVMTKGNHQFFGAKNRLQNGWAKLKSHNLAYQSAPTERVYLKENEVLRISYHTQRGGDVMVEFVGQNNPWDNVPDGRFADGDSGDSFTLKGLYLHRFEGWNSKDVYPSWSAMPNTGVGHQNIMFTFGNKKPLSQLSFGVNDVYSPFSNMPFYMAKHPDLDKRLGISEIRYEYGGVSFLVHRDFLGEGQRKILPNNYNVAYESVFRFSEWQGSGTFVFEQGLVLSDAVKILSPEMKWVVPAGQKVILANGQVWTSTGEAESWDFIFATLGGRYR